MARTTATSKVLAESFSKAWRMGYRFAVIDANSVFGGGAWYFEVTDQAEAFAAQQNAGWFSQPYTVVAL